jgi:N-acetyl-gamma-glutamyl-phosphate reductase
MHKIPVGILGASGYVGRELCALVLRHPTLELRFAAANERRGERARLAGREVTFVASDDAPLGATELVFSALPHGVSGEWATRAAAAGARAVDLSADLRPCVGIGDYGLVISGRARGGSVARGEPSSRGEPPIPDPQSPIPYGLTELMRPQLEGASIVANPGCYPTAVLLALAPLLARELVRPGGTVSIAAASGVTGAGFTPRHDLLFAEVSEDFRAYAPGNTHRHLGEMRAVVRELGGDCDLVFTPHLLPVARGILATITVPLAAPLADPLAPWRDHYAGEPFVEVADEAPSLRDVVRRNVARVTAIPVAGVREPTLLVLAAIDNLLKGAAGQAVQNANLLLGLPEPAGLPA